ncbi:hypothetical protein [Timonella sp. A28]|uniref:hypothetical protein n=1 Tax=Timonella sp. A28 TaxID=3442640 RepID=UPI003EBC4D72
MYKVFSIVLIVVLVAACGILGLIATSDYFDASARAKIDLVELAEDSRRDWVYLDAVDVTDDVCPDLGCVQAVKSPYVSVLKFPTALKALDYERGCDCHAISPIVVHFDGKQVTGEERRDIIYTLSSINAEDDYWIVY